MVCGAVLRRATGWKRSDGTAAGEQLLSTDGSRSAAPPPNDVRPSAWPRDASPAGPNMHGGALPPANQLNPCEGARILARVGTDVILESDVMDPVNEMLAANKDKIPPEQLEATREYLIKKELQNLIQAKLILLDAKQTIPSEHWPEVQKQFEQLFEEGDGKNESEIQRLMKQTGTASRGDLERKLRAMGSSIDQKKRAFVEFQVAVEWRKQQVKHNDEVTPDEMLAYYHQHLGDFTTPARAKWEELMVRTAKYPSDQAAYAALARMGNQVLAGANFAEVAKAASDGPTATSGGAWDWTTKGALVCQDIDRWLFTSPIGQLSPIIKEPNGFHIVRVTCREEQKVTPFPDAQAQIRKKIIKERPADKQIDEYMAKLEAKTPVWTIFDSEQELSNRSTLRR